MDNLKGTYENNCYVFKKYNQKYSKKLSTAQDSGWPLGTFEVATKTENPWK